MNIRAKEIEELENKVKELKNAETIFWNEVTERLEEIKERYGLTEIRPEMTDRRKECLNLLLKEYKGFGGQLTQKEIGERCGIPRRKVSDYYLYLESVLFKNEEITNVKELSKETGLSEKEIIDAAFKYKALKKEPEVMTVKWFPDIPMDFSSPHRWIYSCTKWWENRDMYVRQLMKEHGLDPNDLKEEQKILGRIYSFIEIDFGVSIDERKIFYKANKAFNAVKCDPRLRMYFDAELKCMMDTKVYSPQITKRQPYVAIAKDHTEYIDPEVLDTVERLINEWK